VIDPASNPAVIDTRLDSRSATFENPTGARGGGGRAHGGRKGAPNRRLEPGERVVLADIEGPGVIRHIWMTFPPSRPEKMRSLYLEVFYDDLDVPSISVPCLDFFGLPHGRPVAYHSALTAAQEGRGFNSYIPMPFGRRVRVEIVNGSTRRTMLYYQVDYTLQAEIPEEFGRLHASFRRENPTIMRHDFVIADGFRGPGRFLGCNVGVRVIDPCTWYGEGEVKIYRDGDTEFPTICGTGLEDYVGSAWGLGAHSAPYGGTPLSIGPGTGPNPEFVGFYRWHGPDPVMFERELRVTIQQIGAMFFLEGQEAALEEYERTNPVAGEGWIRETGPSLLAWGIAERVDDYCATAYVYCRDPQAVPVLDVDVALADITRRSYEQPSPLESISGVVDPSAG
jgi:hypothetical protein